MDTNPFDRFAEPYDKWFDSPNGQIIFSIEADCLREIVAKTEGRWLEVGVGTGRFAKVLDIKEGIDSSEAVLEFAAKQGILTRHANAENLPYSSASFNGVLMVVTICFLAEPLKALQESIRVLKNNGRLIVGLVPADSTWGKAYAQKGMKGHRFYSTAKFYTCEQVISLAKNSGLAFNDARSCLFTMPDEPISDLSVQKGIVQGAGFVALEFVKADSHNK